MIFSAQTIRSNIRVVHLLHSSVTLFFSFVNVFSETCIDTTYRAIGLMSRVFANSPGDLGSIPGQVISKTQKMVFGAALLSIIR